MKEKIRTILEAIHAHSLEKPDALCLADNKISLTYSEACLRIQKCAGFLFSKGVKKGDIVLIRVSQTVLYAICYYAIQYVGAISCPIDKAITTERVSEIVDEIGAKWYADAKIEDAPSGPEPLNLKEMFSYEVPLEEKHFGERIAAPNDIADIIYTTGTTGKSKGIMVSHKTDIAIAENVVDSVSMTGDEREMVTSQIGHALGVRRMNAAMYIGSACIIADKFVFVNSFFKLLDKYSVTAITFVPSILKGILDGSGERIREYNGRLHYIQLGAAPLPESLKEEALRLLPDVRLYNTYGATESGCTIILEFSKYLNKKNCIGRTTVNTKLIFVDENRREVNAVDEKSAAYLSFEGDMNMSGYINAPELTATVLSNGRIYTNDIGYLGSDGLVYMLGRSGEIINLGGFKINPVEIETAVQRYPGIADCACVPKEDELLGQVPKLFVVMESGQEVDLKDLSVFLRKYLEDYKVPKEIEIISSIPRTFNGKIVRRKLMES